MTDRRRGEGKEIKRDQQVRREVLDEIGTQVNQEGTPAQYRNPNRDQARGDWDRSGRHTDEEA
jgi:ADP-ribose pyrophosphatase YjhB (NUDIX family)